MSNKGMYYKMALAYDEAVVYNTLDMVKHDGEIYVASRDGVIGISPKPNDTINWLLITEED